MTSWGPYEATLIFIEGINVLVFAQKNPKNPDRTKDVGDYYSPA